METAKRFTKRWIGKQNVVHSRKRILVGHKKEWSTDIHYDMTEPRKHCGEWKKPVTKNAHAIWVYLYEIPTTGKSSEIESRSIWLFL